MTVTPDAAARRIGMLPLDHPLAVRLIEQTRKDAVEVAAKPLHEQHPQMGHYLDAVTGLDLLAAAGETIVWVAWVDHLPPAGFGRPASRGGVICAAYWQTGGWTIRSGASTRESTGDPQSGDFARAMYRTGRRHQMALKDGTILDMPVWRLHRPDRPHKPVCTQSCAECGTGDYWNLPEFVWSEPSIGLADPGNPSRLAREEKFLWALGGPRNYGKVVLTDHALFDHGATGVPETRRRGRVLAVREKADGDTLVVRWNNRGGESVVKPTEVQRPEPLSTGQN